MYKREGFVVENSREQQTCKLSILCTLCNATSCTCSVVGFMSHVPVVRSDGSHEAQVCVSV